MKKDSYKKPFRDVMGITSFGIGVSTAQSLAPGVSFAPLTSKLPVMGSIIGSGMVLGELEKLNKKVRRL